MGWSDYLGTAVDTGLNIGTGGLYHKVKNAVTSPAPPGVGGPAQDPSRLVQQANGTFVDPATGTSYTDASGGTPVAAPNVAQQVAQAGANGQNFINRIGTQDQRSGAGYALQTGLAGDLNEVIHNPNAPSVAQQQLNQSLGNIDRQQLAGTAGVSGPNAAAARQSAFRNIGNLDLQAAGQAALLRANEVANARNALGGVAQNISGNAATSTGQDIGAATDYSQQAMQGASGNQQAAQQAHTANGALITGLANGAGGALTKML